MEYKIAPAFVTKIDDDSGTVEAVFSIFGNIDDGMDIVHSGSFVKTFSEHGHRVRVLDQHRTQSGTDVIGKPLQMKELAKADLPTEVKDRFPDASGGAFAKIQFNMETERGKDVFSNIKGGFLNEWSFGFEVHDFDFDEIEIDGKDVTVRNIRTVQLWEISPVIWGMNPATSTGDVKAAFVDHNHALLMRPPTKGWPIDTGTRVRSITETAKALNEPLPSEVAKAGGRTGPVTIDVNLEVDGNELGQATLLGLPKALHLDDEEDGSMHDVPDPVKRMGSMLVGHMLQIGQLLSTDWLIQGRLTTEEHGVVSDAVLAAIQTLESEIPEEVFNRVLPKPSLFMFSRIGTEASSDTVATPTKQVAPNDNDISGAGPGNDPPTPDAPSDLAAQRGRAKALEQSYKMGGKNAKYNGR